MSIYYPEADLAIEVIPEPEGLPPTGYGEKTVLLYIGENQVDSEPLLDAVAELARRRAAQSRASEGAQAPASSGGAQQDAGSAQSEAASSEEGPRRDTARKSDSDTPRKSDSRTPGEVIAELFDAEETLADRLSSSKGADGHAVEPMPAAVLLGHLGDQFGWPLDDADDEQDDEDEPSYEDLLEDWLDDICSPGVLGLRYAVPSVNVGRCKNLYLSV